MGHARCDRAVRLLHQASNSNRAGAGSRGWTSPVPDTQRVSHSKGHTHRHQFQPGIITEPLGSLTAMMLVVPRQGPDPLHHWRVALVEIRRFVPWAPCWWCRGGRGGS